MFCAKKCKNLVLFSIAFMLFFMGAEIFAQEKKQDNNSQKIIYTEKQNAMRIKANDVRLVEAYDENGVLTGYHLYVRKIKGIESILLTETTKDPEGKSDSYAYRALEYNSINGDEIRYLDGHKLVSEGAKYSLIDSTAEKTDFFNLAFHIYIPKTIQYGYDWSRNGIVEIGKGTFINIRTFEKPYADYSGDYMDSPFMFNLETRKRAKPAPAAPEKEAVVLTDDYNPAATQKFTEISDFIVYSKGPETIVEDILKVIDNIGSTDNLDLIFAIDATGSMKNDIEMLKKKLLPALLDKFEGAKDAKFGLLFYRDYGDSFNYKGLPVRFFGFTESLGTFNKNLNSIRIIGKEGGDIPEAVYEAIYASVEYYNWRADSNKQIILIGDAEPHPKPRGTGKYSHDYVMGLAQSRGIGVKSIILPDD